MFSKVKVNGGDAQPVYRWLRSVKKGLAGGKIRWNFTEYLVGRDGTVISRGSVTRREADDPGAVVIGGDYAPTTEPEKIAVVALSDGRLHLCNTRGSA